MDDLDSAPECKSFGFTSALCFHTYKFMSDHIPNKVMAMAPQLFQ